jgi:hypothetical protein
MIAQVSTTRGEMKEEDRSFVEGALEETRRADGCEGALALFDPTTGEGMGITLWRDHSAADAFLEERARVVSDARQRSDVEVGEPRRYEVLARL